MRVFVTGGTGAVGRYAVRALVEAGHEVHGSVRSTAKADQLRDDGGIGVEVSIFDSSALAEAFEGVDAVVNLATAIPPAAKAMSAKAWAVNERVRSEGSTAIVDAALAAGVPRVVQESVAFVYTDGGDEWIDETHPTDDYEAAQSSLAAEANTDRFTEQGGIGVVLRFGWFYGTGAAHSEEFFAMAQRHVCVQMGRSQTYVSSIHVEDAGMAVAAALDAPAGVYNVVDDEPLTKRAFADALAEAAGTRPWLRVPGPAALLFGDKTTSLTRSLRVRNHHFREATAWAPIHPSAREGWAATAERLAA